MGLDPDSDCGSPRPEAAVPSLAEIIDRNREVIERRWLERVQSEVAEHPGTEPSHLRDGLPDYLTALVELLAPSGREHFERRAQPAWAKVAQEHGVTRVRIGFDINQLVREFVILRQVIEALAREQGLSSDASSHLTDALEAAVEVAVSAYVDARDLEARKRQAENVSFLTHELRSPLSTAMLGASQLRSSALPEQQHLLDLMERNHRRLTELIDSVLLTEKLEAGKMESRPVTLTLEQIMEPALEAARVAASHKGIEFFTRYDPELIVWLDPGLTHSALHNLADNSVKYVDHGRVDVAVDQDDERLTIHVRDTCGGISKEELRTIFEPFKRGASRKSGTGLGLSIARRAIEAQGGTVGAESPGTNGCHFWISLPRRATWREGTS